MRSCAISSRLISRVKQKTKNFTFDFTVVYIKVSRYMPDKVSMFRKKNKASQHGLEVLNAPSESSMGKRQWFRKNRGKKSKQSDLHAELSRVKSDNEVLLMRNRNNEDDIEELQQKIADCDKFMSDASQQMATMTGRIKDCLASLNKISPARATVEERKPTELDDNLTNDRRDVQLANMMQSVEAITCDLETYAQLTRSEYASHELIMKNRSRWATRRILFAPFAARRSQEHDTVNDLQITDIEKRA